jgi:arginase family enzyme
MQVTLTAGVRDTGKLLEYNRGMAKKVEKVIKSGQLCLTLGGDHSGTSSVHSKFVSSHYQI